ncbi:MAG: V-type ATP synthase subunit I [Candidatus Diapherotrites archaeon]|nr:V-type ATP synthase subunit I [Candidatus Diapherotrites archaeon]
MFKPARVRKYSVAVLQKDAEKVLSGLHEEGIVETRNVDLKAKKLEAFEAGEREKFAAFSLTKIKRAFAILSPFEPKKSLPEKAKEFLFVEKIEKRRPAETFQELKKLVLEKADPVLKKAEEIEEKNRELHERESSLREETAVLESLKDLDMELQTFRGFENIEVIIGRISPEFMESAQGEISRAENASLLKALGKNKKEKIIIVAAGTDESDALLKNLKKTDFSQITLPELEGKPAVLLKKTAAELEKTEKEKKRVAEQAAKLLLENRGELLAIGEMLEIDKSVFSAFAGAGKTETTASFDVFVPEKKAEAMLSILEKSSSGRFYAEQVKFEEKEAPILLENPGFIKNFEFLLKLYGLPEYNAIDPTPFMAFVFPVFYGLALADIGYGAILAALMAFLHFTWGRKSDSIRQLTNIIFVGSIMAVLFGIVFGSFFGDAGGEAVKAMIIIDPLGKTFMGVNATLFFFGIILSIALLHINLGIVFGILEELRKKNIKGAITDKFANIVLEAGALFCVLGQLLGFGAVFLYAGLALLALALVLFTISGGLLGFMRMTGLLGNWLSYIRLAALGMSTTIIAMAVNRIAILAFTAPFVGFIAAGLILLLGHTVNFLFGMLSSFTHPLRLHFVEFFGFFYEGSGKEFRPYTIKRKFTKKEVE